MVGPQRTIKSSIHFNHSLIQSRTDRWQPPSSYWTRTGASYLLQLRVGMTGGRQRLREAAAGPLLSPALSPGVQPLRTASFS